MPRFIGAQEAESKHDDWRITLSPMSLFDHTPRLRMGVEYIDDRKWSYGIDVGYGNTRLTQPKAYGREWADDYQVFEFRPEVKYFFDYRLKFNHYIAFELFHINASDVFYGNYYYPEDQVYLKGFNYISTDYRYMKTGCDIKYGLKWNLLKRLDLEAFVGIGAAQRIHDYSNVNLSAQSSDIPETLYGEEYRHEGTTYVLHVAFGFRLGYAFK